MGARIQAHDWTASPLGPPSTWSPSFRAVLNAMLGARFPVYMGWGPDLISFYNDAYRPYLGVKPDALDRPLRQVWPEAWDTVGPMAERALRGEASFFEDLPLVVERKGYPEQTWWTGSVSPLAEENGEVGGVLAIVKETTDQVLNQRRLQFLVDLDSRLRHVVNPRDVMAVAAEMLGRHLGANRVGYGEIDAGGEILTVERDWSEASTASFTGRYRLADFDPGILEELRVGRTVRIDDATADPRTADRDIAAAYIAAGKRASIVVPLVKDGRFVASFYVHQTGSRQWRDDEVTLARDVAERTWEAVGRVRSETTLRESEERFRQFAEHSTDVLWMLDAQTMEMEYVSPAYERVWGQPREVFRNRRQWIETIHPDNRERAAQALENVLRGEVVVQEYRVIRPDGSMRWIRATVFPVFDEQGIVRRVAGIAQDITQHDGSMVYVVNGDEATRRDLSFELQNAGYEVNEFSSQQAFLEIAPVLVPGCVVLNIDTRDPRDLTIPGELKGRRGSLPVIVVAEAKGDVAVGVQAMKAGAVDFLNRPHRPDQLLDAVASALAMIRETAELDQATERVKALIAALSAREREVLEGLLAGGTNKTIARDLGISPRTVEAHRARIMERLGAQSLPELVQIAVRAGLQVRPQGGDDPQTI